MWRHTTGVALFVSLISLFLQGLVIAMFEVAWFAKAGDGFEWHFVVKWHCMVW